jgi:hypothetical protein
MEHAFLLPVKSEGREENRLPCITVTLVALWLVCCSGAWRAAAATVRFEPYGPLRLVNQQPCSCCFATFFRAAEVTPVRHVDVDLNVALTNTVVG